MPTHMRTDVRFVNRQKYAFLSATKRTIIPNMSNPVHARINKRLKELNKSPQQASREAGLSRDYLRTLLGRENSQPKGENATKIAKALGVSTNWLLEGEEVAATKPRQNNTSTMEAGRLNEDATPAINLDFPNLPVYGLAAGAVAGAHALSKDPIEYVQMPAALMRVKDAYAMRVTGESMIPRYFPDELIFIHPGRPVRQGDHVVIQEERDGETYAWIKCLERKTDRDLITRQYNPAAEMRFKLEFVAQIHRVLTPNEILNL